MVAVFVNLIHTLRYLINYEWQMTIWKRYLWYYYQNCNFS